jgi:hypothetical protein
MESTRAESLPPPPGVISSIKAGFDAISTHISVIILPLLLDLFLWLGPRLRMDTLFNSIKADMISIWRAGGIPSTDIKPVIQWYETTLPATNLFSLISTIPVGISSLFNSHVLGLLFPGFSNPFLTRPSAGTPLGYPPVLQVTVWNLFGWMFVLIVIGWIFGGLYFRNVAWLASVSESDRPLGSSRAIVQTVLISIFWAFICLMIGIPILLVLRLLLQINPLVAQLAALFLSLVSMWVIVPLFFSPHGVFLKKQNFLTSILSSIQMARFTLPTSSMFILTIFLLSVGLNFLWSIPPEDSWMTLVGIFGHAFVSTALLAGSFIYYRDMNAWLQNVIERIRSNISRQA